MVSSIDKKFHFFFCHRQSDVVRHRGSAVIWTEAFRTCAEVCDEIARCDLHGKADQADEAIRKMISEDGTLLAIDSIHVNGAP